MMNSTAHDVSELVLLTGASGLLGRYLRGRLADGNALVPLSRSSPIAGGHAVDLCDNARVAPLLDEIRPSVIVHAAALANVDACERDPVSAWRMNVEASRNLVEWAARQSKTVQFIYISTDQIYDAPGPSTEDDPKPENVYALTKLWAEDFVRRLPAGVVLRVNFLGTGAENRNSLIDWLVKSLRAQCPITLFKDAWFNPLYAGDLADVVAATIRRKPVGVFNCGTSDQGMSKAELGLFLAETLRLSASSVKIGSIEDVTLVARRPRDTRMECSRLATALKLILPDTKATLGRLVEELSGAIAHGARDSKIA